MFENQPKGLYALSIANTGERFGYYTMIAVFALFMKDNFGLSEGAAGVIYSVFLGLVYFLPLIGGALADRLGYGKMVTAGIFVMLAGYALMATPFGNGAAAMVAVCAALLLVCVGTGLFKGNLQVIVGNLYDDPRYSASRDAGFSIFYMAINVGSMFAATAAIFAMTYMQEHFGWSKEASYHAAFAMAVVSLVFSIVVYFTTRRTFAHADYNSRTAKSVAASVPGAAAEPELSPKETKERIVALCLVFGVVIFFWMAFQQSGSTLTFFAEQYTRLTVVGKGSAMLFNVWNLCLAIAVVYAAFALFQAKSGWGKGSAAIVIAACVAALVAQYGSTPGVLSIEAPIFQQFNPCFVVALTPVSMAVFAALARRGKEPSAPRKIGYGMVVAACGYILISLASLSLADPAAQKAAGDAAVRVSGDWLIGTYLVLTFAELLLSPIGLSFVSKVAPPKYKGMMMGGWFLATAVGNLLVSIPAMLWGKSLMIVWGVLVVLCLASAVAIFSIMRRLERVA